jgi:hypothetical protein
MRGKDKGMVGPWGLKPQTSTVSFIYLVGSSRSSLHPDSPF